MKLVVKKVVFVTLLKLSW